MRKLPRSRKHVWCAKGWTAGHGTESLRARVFLVWHWLISYFPAGVLFEQIFEFSYKMLLLDQVLKETKAKKNSADEGKKVSPKKGSPKPKAAKETPTKMTLKQAHWAFVTWIKMTIHLSLWTLPRVIFSVFYMLRIGMVYLVYMWLNCFVCTVLYGPADSFQTVFVLPNLGAHVDGC